MPSAQRTIRIARPAGTVFAFLTDPANDRSWRSGVKEISSQDPAGVGRRIHQVVAGPGGRGINADVEVTAFDPPTRYAFRTTSGPVRPVGEYRLIPAREDATDVTFSLSAEVSGWKRFIMGGAVQKSMDGEMAGLDTAKRLIETA